MGARMSGPAQDPDGPKALAAYLTPAQVADMLQLSAKSVYRLAKADATMPMLKVGGAVRFPRERLERWLHQREQGRPRTGSLSSVQPNRAVDKESASA